MQFNSLHLEYTFDSDVEDLVAKRWVMASLETYCSTINTIRDTTMITYSIIYNGSILCDHEKMISGGGSTIDFGTIEGCKA